MKELLEKEFFLQNIFNAIPAYTLIVNSLGQVLAVNNAVSSLFGNPDSVEPLRGGDVLHCIYSYTNPQGCGFGDYCRTCIVRQTALKALSGQNINRAKGDLQVIINNEPNSMHILVSANYLEYNGQHLAIVIVEDVSLITELAGYLETCAWCRRVKTPSGEWQDVEKYIQSHSELTFDHGICPLCKVKVMQETRNTK